MKKVYYGKAVYDNREINAVIKVLKNDSLSLVDGNNVKMFNQIKEIDGFLIGGASKSSKKFIDIIKNYYR